MLDICDLLSLVKQADYNKLNNVDIFGYVTRKIEVPSYLKGVNLDNGTFLVEVKLFGVHFRGNDIARLYHGDGNPKQMYFCYGSMVSCLSDTTKIGDWFTFSGKLSQPRGTRNVINMFKFRRNLNKWVIGEPDIEDIDPNSWDLNGRLYEHLMNSNSDNTFYQPAEVRQYLPCVISDNAPSPTSSEGFQVIPPVSDEAIEPLSKDEIKEEEKIASAPQPVDSRSVISVSNIGNVDNTGTRFELLKKNPVYYDLDGSLHNALEARSSYLEAFSEMYKMEDNEFPKPVLDLFDKVKAYWNNKPLDRARTGKGLVKDYIEKSGISVSAEYLGSTVGKYLLSLGTQLIDYSLGLCELEVTKDAKDATSEIFGSYEKVYGGLLALITGTSVTDMLSTVSMCTSKKISFSKLVNTNPYSLVVISQSLGFKDIENIALCLGFASQPKVQRGRNIGILYDYTMHCDGGSTVYSKQELYAKGLGVELTKANYSKVTSVGTYFPQSRQDELRGFINSNLSKSDWSYPKSGWQRVGMYYRLSLSHAEIDKAIRDFINSGMGVESLINKTSWICSTVHLKKELFVYDKLYQLAKRNMHYDLSKVDEYIAEFEEMKGFKLEERQRDAVRLVAMGAGAVTGPAGSGKTTVSEAMVFIMRKLKSKIKIQFGAPTGKASKRLQEVVGEQVRTMHSMFSIGLVAEDLFDNEQVASRKDPDAYFFDENAMVTIDLLYSVLSKVNRAQIFFLGDINQLPPIGKGVPFKSMLGFLPYVALNVSKRSADGSGITSNSKIINENSESNNWKPLENTDDFRLIECADDEIAEVVRDLCSYHLGKTQVKPEGAIEKVFDADDIQVVSPVSTTTYTWATKPVNKDLQNVFNPPVYGQSFVYGVAGKPVASYRIGDRVIHTSNRYDMQHYSSWQGGRLRKTKTQGIMNGDVGKIVGILHSMSCQFFECEDDFDDETEKTTKVEPRNDSSWNGETKYFIVVKYYDVEAKQDIFMLYQAQLDTKVSIDTERVYMGLDLSNIQLAYSLTVHKMQGSQSKLIIITLGALKRAGFINRNMIYTAITRGEDLVYVVGNVGNNRNSTLSVARTQVATNGVVTIMDILQAGSVA